MLGSTWMEGPHWHCCTGDIYLLGRVTIWEISFVDGKRGKRVKTLSLISSTRLLGSDMY